MLMRLGCRPHEVTPHTRGQVRRRSRAEARVEPPATGAAAHSLRGYEGIDIIRNTGGGRDK